MTPSPSPLTLNDVIQALGDTDPNQTNAGAIRQITGRGSFATIQKHLDTIRAQRNRAAHAQDADPVPPAPPELLSMWGAAVAVAVAQVRTRLDSVVQERDTLAQALQTAHSDVMALTGELEATTARAEASDQALAQLSEAQMQGAEQQARQMQQMEAQHAAALAPLVAQVEAAQHQVQVEQLQAKIAAQALQATIDRLTDQVGEYKALLHKQATASPQKPR